MEFIEKVRPTQMTVGIFGLGYVGIPLAISVAEAGFKVIGFDINPDRVNELNTGKCGIRHIPDQDIINMQDKGFQATTDFSRTVECDALIICVPTPLNESREPDMNFIRSTMEKIAPFFRAGQLLALESTTWPGTTNEILRPYIEKLGFEIGNDFFLVYSPEREDPGNAKFPIRTIPKIVGGHTKSCLKAGMALYSRFFDTVYPVSSTQTAEMVKLLENIHRSVNIGLMNEMKIVADAMGLDIHEVIEAAKTKPFGFTPYYPGPGVGGHCIPVDPFYLTWKAREYGLHTRFVELAGEINAAMPQYVVEKTVRALNNIGIAPNGANVLALGVAYKRDVSDTRGSPSLVVIELLRKWGAQVLYSDPYILEISAVQHSEGYLKSVELTPEVLKNQDAVILLTDHSDFDYEMIRKNSRLLLDTRGKYTEHPEVIQA